jgi:predicted transcriptional regulator YdeE
VKTIVIEPIQLIGIETRTTNSNEINGNGKIPQIIQSFYSNVLHKISDRDGDQILAVYTDYESDEHGEYTYFIGAKVKESCSIPDGMVKRTIPSARYQIIPSETGKIPEIVLNAWQNIWQDADLKNRRTYTTDFELYDENCLGTDKVRVDIYIAVKDI